MNIQKQIQKLGGLNLVENSSGKHKGETTISKRGRKRLRRVLFNAVMALVAKNEEFRELHKYYTTRAQNPLKRSNH
ncbi:transposase [Thermoanaerobacter ethanolicus JW 200]|nr:transposase [Thermoanaerobacter ethanolicus JW 200]